MKTPLRILRAHIAHMTNLRAHWRPSQWAREAKILQLGLAILTLQGRHATTAGGMAAAIGIAPATLRRYFADIDALMGEILRRHLATLEQALNAIPANTPNLHAARRKAWHQATRTETGALTDAHLLFLRDRHMLPPDILPALNQTYQTLAARLAPGAHGPAAQAILDLPLTTADRIEPLFAALTGAPAQPQAPRLAAAPLKLDLAPLPIPIPATLPRRIPALHATG